VAKGRVDKSCIVIVVPTVRQLTVILTTSVINAIAVSCKRRRRGCAARGSARSGSASPRVDVRDIFQLVLNVIKPMN